MTTYAMPYIACHGGRTRATRISSIIGRDGKILSQLAVKDDEVLKKAIKLIEAAIRAK